MGKLYGLFSILLLSAQVSSNEVAETNVVSLVFCESRLPAEDKMSKKMLEEVHTYAELKDDPRAALPESFTVCSTIMTTGCQSYEWPTFFHILDDNRSPFLSPSLSHGIQSRLVIVFDQIVGPVLTGKIPPVFPNQWTSSCIAVNTTSGLVHWVVEGTLVLSSKFMEVKNSKNSQPKDLSRNLVLGASSYFGSWFASTERVTNLNIFSSPLTTEKMERMTRGGICIEEGDYLAWGDMEWILHGQAKIETTEKEETCEEKPLVDLSYTPFPAGMDLHAPL